MKMTFRFKSLSCESNLAIIVHTDDQDRNEASFKFYICDLELITEFWHLGYSSSGELACVECPRVREKNWTDERIIRIDYSFGLNAKKKIERNIGRFDKEFR